MIGKVRLWMPGSDGEAEFYNIYDGEHKYFHVAPGWVPPPPIPHQAESLCLLFVSISFLTIIAWYWMRDTPTFRRAAQTV